MGLDKSGNIQFRCKHSRCKYCKYYIEGYKCKYNDYILLYTWNNYDDPKEFNCDKFESTIKPLGGFVFRDYDAIPIREYGVGLYRFDKMGNKI